MADETLVINLKIDATQSAKSIAELTKRNRELAKVIKQAPREGQEGFEELNEELKKAKNEFAKNREEINKFNRSLRETDVASDSLKGLSRSLRTLEEEYKKLGKEQRDAIGGQQLKRQINQTRAQLKRLESDIGDSRRNVGNYGAAWGDAGRQIAGLGRTAQRTLSAVRFLSIGAFSSVFEGAKIAAEGIRQLSEFMDSNVGIQRRISEASSEVAGKFIEEKSELDNLIVAADANNESTEEAVAARNTLLDQYGDILSAEARNALLIGETTLARKEATAELIKNLALEGQREQLKNIFKELADAELDAIKQTQFLETTTGQLTDNILKPFTILGEKLTGTEVQVSDIQTAISENTKQNLIDQAKDADKIGAGLEKSLKQVNDIINANFGAGGLSKSSDASAKALEGFSSRSSKASNVLNSSLSSLKSQLSSVNKTINETVAAGDREALIPLIDQAKQLEQQIEDSRRRDQRPSRRTGRNGRRTRKATGATKPDIN